MFQNCTASLNLITHKERNCQLNLSKAGIAETGGDRSDCWNFVPAGSKLGAMKSGLNRILERYLLCQLFPRCSISASLNVTCCVDALSSSHFFFCLVFFSIVPVAPQTGQCCLVLFQCLHGYIYWSCCMSCSLSWNELWLCANIKLPK